MRLFRYLPGAEVSSSYRKEHDPRFDRSLTRRGTADGVSSAALPPHKHLKHEQDEQPQQAAFAAVLGLMDSLSLRLCSARPSRVPTPTTHDQLTWTQWPDCDTDLTGR